ncbi:MAG: methyltransferase domain-containing protein [Actinomycetota bacterium]|nr:methyltransferase domain-containing protein [Actinomycetota bacterium]
MTSAEPDQERAIRQYHRLAPVYDAIARFGMRYRRMAVDRLQLRPGESVVDVACGTGLNFDYLYEQVGPSGRIIGIDLSGDMLVRARERVDRAAWRNVTLIESAAESANIPASADAAIFSLTHDVMRSREAVENVISFLKPGSRVAVLGAKWAPRWVFPINLFVRAVSRAYVTTLEGYERPWSHLEDHVPNLEVKPLMLGAFYIAIGRRPI